MCLSFVFFVSSTLRTYVKFKLNVLKPCRYRQPVLNNVNNVGWWQWHNLTRHGHDRSHKYTTKYIIDILNKMFKVWRLGLSLHLLKHKSELYTYIVSVYMWIWVWKEISCGGRSVPFHTIYLCLINRKDHLIRRSSHTFTCIQYL